jgi:hypothetical protein
LVFEDVSPKQSGFGSGFARLLNLELHIHGHLQLVSRVQYSTAAVVAVAGMGSEASKQGATKLKQAEA